MFCLVVLTTGPIWGKPIWGTWWTWDGRLTLTLFLFFLLLGYHTLRAAIREPLERARFSAVLGDHGPGAGAVHSPERLPLARAAPQAGGAQAQRAVAAAGDAPHPAHRVRGCSRCCTSDS